MIKSEQQRLPLSLLQKMVVDAIEAKDRDQLEIIVDLNDPPLDLNFMITSDGTTPLMLAASTGEYYLSNCVTSFLATHS